MTASALMPFKPEAYNLFHEGMIALAGVEANGLKVDVEYLDGAILQATEKIRTIEKEIKSTKVVRRWKKAYGPNFKLTSNDQLADVLFNLMGFNCPNLTEKGNFKTDEKTLATIEDKEAKKFITKYLKIKKWKKARDTYLWGIKRHVVDGICRPSFNLHLAKTFRSSCDAPSFQNIPIRIEWVAKLIRSAFVAREGNVLVEVDYSGVEVRIAACYHKDPTMITYIEDKSKDMHRDLAVQIYKLDAKSFKTADKQGAKNLKAIRHCAKNMFVFPEFYGSVWFQCAPNLWDAITRMELKTADGTPLKQHLKRKGITELGSCDPDSELAAGTFAHHIKEIEEDFWNNRFPVYQQWKRDWYAKYKKLGWMKTKNGFILQGYLKRNEVINYPVQGPAFHCLLWSLIQLQNYLSKHMPEIKIVGQIHDSILFDCPKRLLKKLTALCKKVMTQDIRKHWKWIIVPLEIEVDVTPVGGNWFEKEAYVTAED